MKEREVDWEEKICLNDRDQLPEWKTKDKQYEGLSDIFGYNWLPLRTITWNDRLRTIIKPPKDTHYFFK